jgi:hypothetical protein
MKTTESTSKRINSLSIGREEIKSGEYKPTALGITYNNSKDERPFDRAFEVYDWNDLLPALCEELFAIHGDQFEIEAKSGKFPYLSTMLPNYQKTPDSWQRMKHCRISIFKTRSAAEIIGKMVELITHFSNNKEVSVRLLTHHLKYE